ncbi:tRNA 4-thiouridine(8) synthase ThiI [Paenibacillus psychroresistens]|uniref:Probable tRNA sulfurtransferase n=1 Tax=Paenibacillus psychroresistens TaxID=1778678 RepID=A0A6B8RJ29_9BACL|nr:tRNA uracil 4-sulfurtransferase ThiI [Paenibacillus psychroresistens]QGQ95744.1 tRNA 4-thiouridine(8) synthase ThiI [Paenibacillus psychroresistens]
MKPEVIIVRLGDLTLKGKNRYIFEKKIHIQIQKLLAPYEKINIKTEFARFYIELNGESYNEVIEVIKPIFGISSFSPAISAEIDLKAMQTRALEWMQSIISKPQTFKVSVKRANKEFLYDSLQVSYWVGGYILNAVEGLKVDVKRPDLELRVDIRQHVAYIFTEVVEGAGGFPIGSNGKAILMLSGGIDSPVAGWMAMRQGLEIEAIHFHSIPYTSERAKMKVIELGERLALYGGRLKVHFISFAEIQTRLQNEGQPNLLITLMRRSMLRITEKLAQQQNALGIVTGESLGQVASQTLSSLHTIGHEIKLPILRPLIMSDKSTIIQKAEQIGTFDISIQPYEDCCTLFIPKTPSTNPNLKVVQRLERKMLWLLEFEDKALQEDEQMVLQ